MFSSPTKAAEEHNQKRLDHEIRQMVSALTNKITSKHGSSDGTHNIGDDEQGMRIITLSGNNTGATMRADLSDLLDGHDAKPDDQKTSGAYANNNYQAVNNSIMMNGSYSAEDPGVHIFISDFVEEEEEVHHGKKKDKTKKHLMEQHSDEKAKGGEK